MSRSAEREVAMTPLPEEEVLVTVGERGFVVPAACPHRKGRLAYGYVNPSTLRITCPLHRSTYDLATGCQRSGPAAHDLAVRERVPGSVYQAEDVWLPASEHIADWGEDFHKLMLGDRLRMTAFAAAIRAEVKPGSVVVDLGTGTGILARWALEAGAARVYGMDFNKSVLDIAVERIAAAGFGDRFVPVHGLSFDVELPERADVVISETMGNLADNEGGVRILADARDRFLAADGILLPSRMESYLVAVDAPRAHRSVADGQVHGGTLAGHPFSTYYDVILPGHTHLATPQLIRSYEFTSDETDEYTITRSYLVHRAGTFTGFKGYFIADLSRTVTMDISGDDIARGLTSDSWKHCYLPVERPVEVWAGDQITLELSRTGNGSLRQRYRWTGSVLRDGNPLTMFDHQSGR